MYPDCIWYPGGNCWGGMPGTTPILGTILGPAVSISWSAPNKFKQTTPLQKHKKVKPFQMDALTIRHFRIEKETRAENESRDCFWVR